MELHWILGRDLTKKEKRGEKIEKNREKREPCIDPSTFTTANELNGQKPGRQREKCEEERREARAFLDVEAISGTTLDFSRLGRTTKREDRREVRSARREERKGKRAERR